MPRPDEDGERRYGVGMSSGEAWSIWDRGRIGMSWLYINDILINADDHIPYEPGRAWLGACSVCAFREIHYRIDACGLGSARPQKIRKDCRVLKFLRFVGSPGRSV